MTSRSILYKIICKIRQDIQAILYDNLWKILKFEDPHDFLGQFCKRIFETFRSLRVLMTPKIILYENCEHFGSLRIPVTSCAILYRNQLTILGYFVKESVEDTDLGGIPMTSRANL